MCQQCNTIFEVTASFCPVCGEMPGKVTRRRELQVQIQQKQAELSLLASQTSATRTQTWLLDTLAALSLGWMGFMYGLTCLFGPLNVFQLLWSLLRSLLGNLAWMNTETASAATRTLFTVLGLGTGAGRLIVWCLALAYFVFVMLTRRKWNLTALGAYIALSLISMAGSGTNLTYYGYTRNWSLLFPALVVSGLALAAGFLLHRYERLAWPGVALAEVLAVAVMCVSPQASVLSLLAIIPQVFLTFLVGLIGFRAWTIADLETRRAAESEAERTYRSASLAKEVENLNQELALLETKTTV